MSRSGFSLLDSETGWTGVLWSNTDPILKRISVVLQLLILLCHAQGRGAAGGTLSLVSFPMLIRFCLFASKVFIVRAAK